MILEGLTYADRLTLATRYRHKAIQSLFTPNITSLSSLMGPMSDGPEWPSGAAWIATVHDNHPCIVTDGLSDPWVERDRAGTGLGLEVFIESTELTIPDDLSSLSDTWMFPMIAEISHTLASYPKLCEKLCSGEVLSMEFNIDHIKDGRGRVGALLHTPADMFNNWESDLGDVLLVAATLLTPDELRFLRGKGQIGKEALLGKLYQENIGHRSTINRTSVV